MNFNFKFTNLCGTVYHKGNVLFAPDGNTLASPVGNRVTLFDLVNNTSFTLPFETRKDIRRMAFSNDSKLLIIVDVDGLALLLNYNKKVILSPFNFKSRIHFIQFSPDGRFFAVNHHKKIHLWKTPSFKKEFAPFIFHREYFGHNDKVTCFDWSADSEQFLSGSRDMTVKIHRVQPKRYDRIITLAGHRDTIVGCYFGKDDMIVYSVARDGALYVWRCEEEWVEEKRMDMEDSEEEENVEEEVEEEQEEEEQEQEEEQEEQENGDSMSQEQIEDGDESHEEDGENDEEAQEASSESSSNDSTPKRKITRWRLAGKYFFWSHNASKVKSCKFHKSSNLLVVGFQNGVFGLYDLESLEHAAIHGSDVSRALGNKEQDEITSIQKLSLSKSPINTVDINNTGEWLSLGVDALGQLIVWEWQSERYIFKQLGHEDDLKCLSYSREGQFIATGSNDGSIKVWNTSNGLCAFTLEDHEACVSQLKFSPRGHFLVSSSLDGTVRAFDLIKHQCFRTFTSEIPTQYSCVSIDPSSEIVAAGSKNDFQVFLWSIQTGKLLDVLEGHEGPITSVCFCPTNNGQLATSSWDKTVKVWDVYSSKVAVESFDHGFDITCIQYRPDGKQLCVATLDGCLYFWNMEEGVQECVIEGRKDISGGRGHEDARTAKNNPASKFFTCVSYTADGKYILAGGNSRFICLYDIENRILLKKFQISHNRSLEGVVDYLDTREIDKGEYESNDEDDDDFKVDRTLPGVQVGEFSKRKDQRRIKTSDISFSPSGRQWTCSTSCGLMIYSLDDLYLFDPYMLDINITPDTILATLKEKDYLKALIMSLRLNEYSILSNTFLNIPHEHIKIVASSVHPIYMKKFVQFIARHMESSPHLEFHLRWIQALFHAHGQFFKDHSPSMVSTLRSLQRSILKQKTDIEKISEENKYWILYTKEAKKRKVLEFEEEEEEEEEDVMVMGI